MSCADSSVGAQLSHRNQFDLDVSPASITEITSSSLPKTYNIEMKHKLTKKCKYAGMHSNKISTRQRIESELLITDASSKSSVKPVQLAQTR